MTKAEEFIRKLAEVKKRRKETTKKKAQELITSLMAYMSEAVSHGRSSVVVDDLYTYTPTDEYDCAEVLQTAKDYLHKEGFVDIAFKPVGIGWSASFSLPGADSPNTPYTRSNNDVEE